MKFQPEDIHKLHKLILEIGGVYTVNDDATVAPAKRPEDKFMIDCDKKKYLLKLFPINHAITAEPVRLLNIFSESIGNSEERKWFWSTRSALVGKLMQQIAKVITTSSPEDGDIGIIGYVSQFADLFDSTTWERLQGIAIEDWLDMTYTKPKRTTTATARILDETYRTANKKLRKTKEWLFLDKLYSVLGLNEPEKILYKSEILGCAEADSRLHVFADLLDKLEEPVNVLMGIDLRVSELTPFLGHVQQISAISSYMVTHSSKKTTSTSTTSSGRPELPAWLGMNKSQLAPVIQPLKPDMPAFMTPSQAAAAQSSRYATFGQANQCTNGLPGQFIQNSNNFSNGLVLNPVLPSSFVGGRGVF